MTTTQEQLNQINAAILAIETGCQEYRIGNRSLKRADINYLYAERRSLQAQLSQDSNTGFGVNTFVAKFAGR